jgi:hypothetical protein
MFTNDDTNKGHNVDLTFLFQHSHLRLNSCHNDLIKAICSTLKPRYHTNLLSDKEKKKIYDRLYKAHISNIHPIIFILVIVHGGVHVNHVIDFGKGIHAWQYSSKEGWKRKVSLASYRAACYCYCYPPYSPPPSLWIFPTDHIQTVWELAQSHQAL